MKKILAILTVLVFALSPVVFASSYQDVSGVAAVAVALAANGSNCAAGEAAAGVDASGASEGCFAPVTAEVDPTVDTSGEVVAIIGAGVYATDAQGALADSALQTELDPVFSAADTASVHNFIYVDNRRLDVYTETGSSSKPFKTIQSAIDYVASLTPGSDFFTINISSGIYVENVVLENSALRDLKLQGDGYVVISPASGNSLQSTTANDNLFSLYLDNITFTKPVVLTGSNGTTAFSDVLFDNIRLTGTSSLAATCISNVTLKDIYSERPVVYVNIPWSYIEGGQLQGTFSATMDSTQDVPNGGSSGTVLANGIFQSGTVNYVIGGTATYTVAVNGSRWGSGAVTIPTGVTLLAYNSAIRGTQTNNGSVILRNSNVQGYIAGTGTLDLSAQPADQISNAPAGNIAAATVQAAIDELDSEKQAAGSYLVTEVDPTVDTSGEVVAIIGAGVYATDAQGALADSALQPNAVTASGATCTITAIVDGQITGASCA